MATLLKQAGHQVSFALPLDYWEEVHKHGFLSILEVPVPQLKKDVDLGSENNSRYGSKVNADNLSEFRENLRHIMPDLVMLDEQNSFKAIYYQILNVSVVFFISKPDTRKIKGIPPFTTYYLPKQTTTSNLFIEFLWLIRSYRAKIDLIRIKILSGNKDRYSVCAKISKKYGINFEELFEYQRSFGYGVNGVPRLIISPKAFDFPHEEKQGVHRVGPLVDIRREGKIEHPRYETLMRNIEKLKISGKGRIIYASMGTVSRYDLKRCTKLFLRLKMVAQINPVDLFILSTGKYFVLSTGKYFDINILLPMPNNMMVFESVPQVDLLQKCDIMITHGGMNSITECVFCEVPVLVYPLSRNWDQPGNSARVVFHGLGLRGRIESDSVKTISQKLNKLKLGYSTFKQNVQEMKEKFEKHNNSTEVVRIIESYIKK
ncbi:MAG: glycosyltransferase [Bacteroidia bacterium]|nr:glycosyltransferase [Bacteroidia bacterium]